MRAYVRQRGQTGQRWWVEAGKRQQWGGEGQCVMHQRHDRPPGLPAAQCASRCCQRAPRRQISGSWQPPGWRCGAHCAAVASFPHMRVQNSIGAAGNAPPRHIIGPQSALTAVADDAWLAAAQPAIKTSTACMSQHLRPTPLTCGLSTIHGRPLRHGASLERHVYKLYTTATYSLSHSPLGRPQGA
jgi:hypothetical protein